MTIGIFFLMFAEMQNSKYETLSTQTRSQEGLDFRPLSQNNKLHFKFASQISLYITQHLYAYINLNEHRPRIYLLIKHW